MKKASKIIGIVLVFVILLTMVFIKNDKEKIKTIKSEKQLLKIYESNNNTSMSFIGRMLTLPFSIFLPDYNSRIYYTQEKWGSLDEVVPNDAEGTIKSATNSSKQKDYSKTNIQVEGVDEADIIKTNGEYIYSISYNKVIITNVKDSSKIEIESNINTSNIPSDLLLYKDYLIVISTNKNVSRYLSNTIVDVYDVKDKTNPKKVKNFELYEPYYTTRCIDGKLYVFSKGTLRNKNDKIERKYKEDSKTKELSLNSIKYLKDNPTNIQTLIAELDLNSMNSIKLNSYLIDISNSYISEKNIYLTKYSYYTNNKLKISSLFGIKGIIGFFEQIDDEYDYDNTQIYKFNIDSKNGVKLQTSTTIKGKTINQYSYDEKDDNLRIALETDEGARVAILDKNLKILGETEPVAEGEELYASRFIGDKAYIVTYENTDPLFVMDLSDVKNPQVMGELEIPGYSTYLHPYDENHLIGIGINTEEQVTRDENGEVISSWTTVTGMKMCLFDVTDIENPIEISKTTIGDRRTVSAILTNPKALLFSKDKNLLAIPVNNYKENFEVETDTSNEDEVNAFIDYDKEYTSEGYFVYNIDLKNGFKLKGIINHEKTRNNYYYYGSNSKLLRGLYIDDNLYTVSEDYIKVNKLDDLKEISSLKINDKGVSKNGK